MFFAAPAVCVCGRLSVCLSVVWLPCFLPPRVRVLPSVCLSLPTSDTHPLTHWIFAGSTSLLEKRERGEGGDFLRCTYRACPSVRVHVDVIHVVCAVWSVWATQSDALLASFLARPSVCHVSLSVRPCVGLFFPFATNKQTVINAMHVCALIHIHPSVRPSTNDVCPNGGISSGGGRVATEYFCLPPAYLPMCVCVCVYVCVFLSV